jgi:hypothetical protein
LYILSINHKRDPELKRFMAVTVISGNIMKGNKTGEIASLQISHTGM